MKLVKKFFDRLVVLVMALLFLQIPQFIQEYTYHLQGHLSELHYQLTLYEIAAQNSHISLNEYIQKFTTNSDPDFAAQGKILLALVERKEMFQKAFDSLTQAASWKLPFLFVTYFDTTLAKETWHYFKPGLFLDLNSLIFLVIGLLFGILFIQTLRSIYEFSRDQKKRRRHV